MIDTQDQYPGTVVASALWHMEPSIDKAVAAVQGGSFAPEDYGPLSNLAVGGCSVAPIGPGPRAGRGDRAGQEQGGRHQERRAQDPGR